MRYHMNGKGESAKCVAPPGKCPLEGEHYESEEEADSGIDQHLTKKFQPYEAKVSKTTGTVKRSLPSGELSPARIDDEGNETRPAQSYGSYYKDVEKKHFAPREAVATKRGEREFLQTPGSQFSPNEASSLKELVKKTSASRPEGLKGDDREELIAMGADPQAFSPHSTYLKTPVGGHLGSITSDGLPDSTPLSFYEKSPGSNMVSLTVERDEKPKVDYGVLVMGDQSKISPNNPGKGDPIVMTAHPGLPSRPNPERAKLSRDEKAQYDAREHEEYKRLESEGLLTVGAIRKLKGRDFNLNVKLKS